MHSSRREDLHLSRVIQNWFVLLRPTWLRIDGLFLAIDFEISKRFLRRTQKHALYEPFILHLTPAGKVTNYLVPSFSLKWLSVAKLKVRSEASRQKIQNLDLIRYAQRF